MNTCFNWVFYCFFICTLFLHPSLYFIFLFFSHSLTPYHSNFLSFSASLSSLPLSLSLSLYVSVCLPLCLSFTHIWQIPTTFFTHFFFYFLVSSLLLFYNFIRSCHYSLLWWLFLLLQSWCSLSSFVRVKKCSL